MTAHNAILRPVLCACGWTGVLSTKAPCTECGRDWHDRITPERLAVLSRIALDPRTHIQPAMRMRLREIGVLLASGPPRKGGGEGRRRPEGRAHGLTLQGLRVLEAADRVLSEQTRHDVAASVARHAVADGQETT